MKSSTVPTPNLLMISAVIVLSLSAPVVYGCESFHSRRFFGVVPSSLIQKNSKPFASNNSEDKYPSTSSHRIFHERCPPSSFRTIADYDNSESNEEPSDRDARYAIQYSHELRCIRAAEHAYLLHDQEFPVIPASKKQIVSADGRLIDNYLIDV